MNFQILYSILVFFFQSELDYIAWFSVGEIYVVCLPSYWLTECLVPHLQTLELILQCQSIFQCLNVKIFYNWISQIIIQKSLFTLMCPSIKRLTFISLLPSHVRVCIFRVRIVYYGQKLHSLSQFFTMWFKHTSSFHHFFQNKQMIACGDRKSVV